MFGGDGIKFGKYSWICILSQTPLIAFLWKTKLIYNYIISRSVFLYFGIPRRHFLFSSRTTRFYFKTSPFFKRQTLVLSLFVPNFISKGLFVTELISKAEYTHVYCKNCNSVSLRSHLLATQALIVVHSRLYGPKPHPSLVHMHIYKGVECLYANTRTLHYWKSIAWILYQVV